MMDLGQVFTGLEVARFMVSQLDVGKRARILDPCFGTGVFLKACREAGYTNVEGFELDECLFSGVRDRYPEFRLWQGDFLKAERTAEYDAVIMNPPYIRQEKIDNKKELRQNPLYKGLSGKANLYMYFIIRALEDLKPGGEMIVIFPESWQNSRNGRDFEALLRAKAAVEKQIHIFGDIFETDALVEVIILKLIRGGKRGRKIVEHVKLENGSIQKAAGQAQAEWLELPVSLKQYAAVKRGLTTGCNSLFINPPLPAGADVCVPIISSPKNIAGYTTDGAKTDALMALQKEDFSEEVRDYLESRKEEIVRTKTPKTIYEKILDNRRWYELVPIDSRGILFGYFVRADMRFIMNESGTAARDNFYIITPQIDPYLLFSLLNNYYTYYQLECSGKRYGAGLLKLQKYDLENLMFPDAAEFSEEDRDTLIRLAKEMTAKNRNMAKKITEVIADYTKWSKEKVMQKYEKLRKGRLEKI